ncbi:hypothetical protein D3C74_50740 [compost metagenome]
MIPLTEDLLTEVVEKRLKWLNSNVDIVDSIFSSAAVTTRERLKEYLKKNGVRVMRGFPVDRTSLPSYVIMLGGEQEVTQVLGGYLGEDDETYEIAQAVETQRILRHDGMSVVKIDNKPLFTVNSITYDGIDYDVEFEVLDYTRGLVMLDFPVDLVHSNTVEINYVYKESGVESYGTYYNAQYRIETWTENGDLTVILYQLLKWILLSERDYLASNGLAIQNMGGLDFEPAPEYFPAFVYRRALTFDCTLENSYDAKFKFINQINVHGEFVDSVEEGE